MKRSFPAVGRVARAAFRRSLSGIILAGFLLLSATGAKGDMLLFATAEDCVSAPVSSWAVSGPHAVVLQKAGAKAQKAAKQALENAGIPDVRFLSFPAVKAKNRTAELLEKKWATAENIAAIASLLRREKDGQIVYYSAAEEAQRFLSAFADRCAGGANDPAVRKKRKQEDEYLFEVSRLVDGATGNERAPVPADASWRTRWEDGAAFDLSGLPGTDGEGFLPEGEKAFILSDAEQGLWVYLTQTLRIVVTRHGTEGFSWFEAEIFRRPEGETLHVVSSLNGRGNHPDRIAAENGLVLGIDTDYYLYRDHYRKKVGLIIRNGVLVRESAGATTGTSLPPLDTLLLDAEGGFRVDKAGELDSRRALELGAVDVLAFGPILIRDGHLRVLTVSYHNKKEPRTAIGLLGKNHYLMVVAEGRLPNSPGMTLDQLGQLMAVRGCTEAINLDGGHTSALIFMGERLNRIGSLSGSGTSAPRNMTELLGIGTHQP